MRPFRSGKGLIEGFRLASGRVRAERRRAGIRYGQRSGRFRCGERIRRRRTGRVGLRWIRLSRVRARFGRERLGFVHWRDGHGNFPSHAWRMCLE